MKRNWFCKKKHLREDLNELDDLQVDVDLKFSSINSELGHGIYEKKKKYESNRCEDIHWLFLLLPEIWYLCAVNHHIHIFTQWLQVFYLSFAIRTHITYIYTKSYNG